MVIATKRLHSNAVFYYDNNFVDSNIEHRWLQFVFWYEGKDLFDLDDDKDFVNKIT